jgi:hypothetical protein
LGSVLWLVCTLTVAINFAIDGWNIGGLIFEAVFSAVLVRPWFMGVWIWPSHLEIRSWFRTHRVLRDSIRAIQPVGYQGLLVGGMSIGWDPLHALTQVIEIDNGKLLPMNYSGTINTLGTTRSIVAEIRAELDLPIAPRSRDRNSRNVPPPS